LRLKGFLGNAANAPQPIARDSPEQEPRQGAWKFDPRMPGDNALALP